MASIAKLHRISSKVVTNASLSKIVRLCRTAGQNSRGRSWYNMNSIALQNMSTTATTSTHTDLSVQAVRTDPSNPQQKSWRSTAIVTAASVIWIVLWNTTTWNHNDVQKSNLISDCRGYTNDNDDDEEDDPTEHNFDGDDHMEPLDDTDTPKHHRTKYMNAFRPSIFGVKHENQRSRSAQSMNTFDQDFQDVIKNISKDISSSFNAENVARHMKEMMDQIVKPKHNESIAKAITSEQSQADSFQQIIQCLFNILMDAAAVTEAEKSSDEPAQENRNCNIKANITQAVSDLLAAIQKQHVKQQDIQDSKISTVSSSTRNGPTKTDSTTSTIVPQTAIEDTTSIFDLCHLLMSYSDEIHQLVTKHMSNIDYQRITPTAIAYYADYANTQYQAMLQERLDQHGSQRHNRFLMQLRSWQQQQKDQLLDLLHHLQHDDTNQTVPSQSPPTLTNASSKIATIDPSILHIIDSNPDAIALAQLAYADTMEQFRDGLQHLPSQGRYEYELIHCDLKSEPGKPAHFYTIRRSVPHNHTPLTTAGPHQSDGSTTTNTTNTLDVVLVIRGTKTVADAITDLLCDTQPYHRWGKAHSYILDSGRYIANLYQKTFDDLLNNQNISNINVTIYGHSLGAGAGAIAAMELYNAQDRRIQVQMIGYGCPAIVTKNLAEQTSDYITTFINDSDIVPRLSGLSLTNLLYDIIEFDWMPYAQKDVQTVFHDLQEFQPILFNADTVTTMKNIITPILESIHHDTYIPSGTIPRLDVELYPPGKCIHIYRTGHGPEEQQSPPHRSACYVPNWFYNQIDVNKHMIDGRLLFTVIFWRCSFLFCTILILRTNAPPSKNTCLQIIYWQPAIYKRLRTFNVPMNKTSHVNNVIMFIGYFVQMMIVQCKYTFLLYAVTIVLLLLLLLLMLSSLLS